jgi:predicted SAM-dependent methyltransferase
MRMDKCAVDIGCGESKLKGAIGIDLRKISGVNIVADARWLPIRDEALDEIYSSHLVEHFGHQETERLLSEWVRCLKKGGLFEIRCPDLRARCFLFFLNPSNENVRNIYGAQDYSGNTHLCGFSFGLLKKLLERNGITKIDRVIKGYKWIPFIPDSLHIKGTKL